MRKKKTPAQRKADAARRKEERENIEFFTEENAELVEVGRHTLHGRDCHNAMADMDDESVDLIVTSPPYAFGKQYEKGKDIAWLEDLLQGMANQAIRVLKPSAFCFVNFPVSTYFPEMNEEMYNRVFRNNAGFVFHSRRIWKKPIATLSPPPSAIRMSIPFGEVENLFTFRKPPNSPEKNIYRDLASRGAWETPPGRTQEPKVRRGKHGAMFPLELPIMAIRVWSKPGDVVLDPFGGMFTTVLAAHHEDRIGVGCEICSTFFPDAVKRVRDYTASVLPGLDVAAIAVAAKAVQAPEQFQMDVPDGSEQNGS